MAALVKAGCLLRRIGIQYISPTVISVRHKDKYMPQPRNFKDKKKQEKDLSWAHIVLEWPKEKQIILERPPSPLHMVERVQTLKGRPYWEKQIAKDLGLGEKTKKFSKVILKNSPGINTMLKRIKHLVKITPITFPYGLPEEESDFEHCYLRDNGEFVIKKRIPASDVDPVKDIAITTEREDSLWNMDRETLSKHLKKKAQDRDLNWEYFQPDYEYTNKSPSVNDAPNEDRYFGDKGRRNKWF